MQFAGPATDTVFDPLESDSIEKLVTRGAMSRLPLLVCRQLLAEREEAERMQPQPSTKLRIGSLTVCLVIDPKTTDPHSFAFFSGSSQATVWPRARRS